MIAWLSKSPLQFPLKHGSPQWEEYSIGNQFSCYFHKPCDLVSYRNLCRVITLKCVQCHRFLRDLYPFSVSLFCFVLFFKSKWCLPKNSLLKCFSKYLFFRNPLVGSFPVFLVVIRGMIISFNMDIVLTIAVINHFGYWYSPQVLLSPVWVWFRFLNVFMRSVCTMIWPF